MLGYPILLIWLKVIEAEFDVARKETNEKCWLSIAKMLIREN